MSGLLSALLLVGTATVSSSAQGEEREADAPAPSSSSSPAARDRDDRLLGRDRDSSSGLSERLYRAGVAAHRAGRYLAAVHALETSYEMNPRPSVGFALAEAYQFQYFVDEESRHLDRAIALYKLYVERTRGPRRGDAVMAVSRLEPIKSRLDMERPGDGPLVPIEPEAFEFPAHVIVLGNVEDSAVKLDGGVPVPTPYIKEVVPGRHEIEVISDGYGSESFKFIIEKGGLEVIEVNLSPLPAQVSLQGDAGASVWVDGRFTGYLPLRHSISLAPGAHRLAVTREGHGAWVRPLAVGRGGHLRLQADLRPTTQRKISYYVLGLGGLTLAGSAVTGVLSLRDNQKASVLQDKRFSGGLTVAERVDYEAHRSRAESRATVAWSLLGSGLLVSVVGGLLWYIDVPTVEGPTLSAVPTPIQGGAGLVASGRF